MIRIVALDSPEGRSTYGARLQALESLAEYPYGDDHFRLDHGSSYFAFFERMGEVTVHVALDGDEVVACAVGVLRTVPTARGARRAWYLCDLKVHPAYRSRGVPARLMGHRLWRNYLRCGRAYAISMTPNGAENHVVRIVRRFAFVPLKPQARLNIYAFDHDRISAARSEIEYVVGPVSFLSLAGAKDLIMRSTGERLDLLHLQHGPNKAGLPANPRAGAVHMACAVAGSPLDRVLAEGNSPSATATILGHRTTNVNWDFVLTSEI